MMGTRRKNRVACESRRLVSNSGICPHWQRTVADPAADPWKAGRARVLHLIDHAMVHSIGGGIEVLGDIDTIGYCEDAKTWDCRGYVCEGCDHGLCRRSGSRRVLRIVQPAS